MKSVISYMGYNALVEFDAENALLCGNVAGMRDCIYFEAESAADIEQAFHDAVDDYLSFCQEKGKQPEKPFKGSFNVRVGEEIHKQAALAAAAKGQSLNRFVAEAIIAAL